jgi:hypothetical protein
LWGGVGRFVWPALTQISRVWVLMVLNYSRA